MIRSQSKISDEARGWPQRLFLAQAALFVRPNSLCYLSKVFGEVLGRMYSDQHAISVLNIRFGAALADDAPLMRRHYPGT